MNYTFRSLFHKQDTLQKDVIAKKNVPSCLPSIHDVCLFAADRQVYAELVALGVITPREEVTPPTVPMDYNWARVSKNGYMQSIFEFQRNFCSF